eukprot:NODE_552_length_814_cov_107.474510_g489_i0.p1 GENE.NODE_552_length_814_cov_107.474510_g489_i0~~NODE_552_length_814_cov_107.474510_g489_i0.p1  ORF type:complete len:184 (+),score=34.85 NODE_552_length_814_cov_107.474510_g489_i0:77-628(+)
MCPGNVHKVKKIAPQAMPRETEEKKWCNKEQSSLQQQPIYSLWFAVVQCQFCSLYSALSLSNSSPLDCSNHLYVLITRVLFFSFWVFPKYGHQLPHGHITFCVYITQGHTHSTVHVAHETVRVVACKTKACIANCIIYKKNKMHHHHHQQKRGRIRKPGSIAFIDLLSSFQTTGKHWRANLPL